MSHSGSGEGPVTPQGDVTTSSKPARRRSVKMKMLRRASSSTMQAVVSLLERIPSSKKKENYDATTQAL
jgi:hypothetical protein